MQGRTKVSIKQCCICYNVISKQGKLDSCEHTYCFDCIKQWADTKTTCPNCRKQFTFIKETRHKLSRQYSKNLRRNDRIHRVGDLNDVICGSPILVPLQEIMDITPAIYFYWSIE